MNRFKQFIIGMIVGGLIISGIPVLAESGQKTIEVAYNDIKITLNGKEIKTDAEPFQFSGRTFLPIRQVAEALGATVDWNSNTNTVELFTSLPMLTDASTTNTSITYETLARSANDYIGEKVKFTGKVIQVIPGNNEVIYYRVNITNDNSEWSGTILLLSFFSNTKTRFLEGDIIDFTGIVSGYHTYRSVDGTNIEIPRINASSVIINTSAVKDSQIEIKNKVYSLGEEALIYNKQNKKIGSLKIISVTETTERNKYSQDKPAQVIVIEYEYRNSDSAEELYIHDASHFQVIDALGGIGKSYPNISAKGSVPIPKGSYCKAISHIGLENKSDSIKLNYKFSMFSDKTDISFILPVK